MRYIYSAVIFCYGFAIFIFSFFNKKAKLWIKGRKDIFKQIQNNLLKEEKEIVWFHAASLGEFEQARTVIERIKLKYPEYSIVLTFFSPSGYEIRKNYSNADYIFYLPLDTPKNARKFLDIVKPKYVFFIKYEFWFNYLRELRKREIPSYIISAIFRPKQHFFKFYGVWFRNQLKAFSVFFVQNAQSLKLLASIGFTNVVISGDTRFDRVVEIAKNPHKFPIIEQFKQDKPILLVGSSWPEDEKLISQSFYNKNAGYKIIFAPHEINNTHISSLKALFPATSVCYSEAEEGADVSGKSVLIIDSIGMLSSLYAYATLAFIGGGFGKGIHNILEAVVFGVPVCFGPHYKKFQEAVDLINIKGGFCIQDEPMLNHFITLLFTNQEYYKKTSEICTNYIHTKAGATSLILTTLKDNLEFYNTENVNQKD